MTYIINFVYNRRVLNEGRCFMKHKTFIDELKAADVKIVDGGSHLKLYYKGRQSTCPRHPSHEISNAFAKKIKKQLGVN